MCAWGLSLGHDTEQKKLSDHLSITLNPPSVHDLEHQAASPAEKNSESLTPVFKVDYKSGAQTESSFLYHCPCFCRLSGTNMCFVMILRVAVSCARSPNNDKRSSQTYRLEEEQRPNIVPLRVDHFIQHAEPKSLLPVRVFGVVDTVLQMPVVLFHDGDRTPRHASLR